MILDTSLVFARFAAEFSTERMPWAAITMDTMEHGFLPGERIKEKL